MRLLPLEYVTTLVRERFAVESLLVCLASPRNSVELFAPKWMSQVQVEEIEEEIVRSRVEIFSVEEIFSGEIIDIECISVKNDVFLDFIEEIWMTSPMFRGFYGGFLMAGLGGRLSRNDSHDFFCENPCDYLKIESKLDVGENGWILVNDRYTESNDFFLLGQGDPVLGV